MPTLIAYPTGPQNQALATLRYRAAAEALGWQIILGKEGVDTVYPERVHQADVVLISRDFPRFFADFQRVLTTARASGKPVLYDLDDLLLAIPPEHPYRADYQDALGGILYAITEADQVVVSTPLLRELLLPLQPHVTVWPTLLPDALWPLQSPQRSTGKNKPDQPLVLGYMGGMSHTPDLEMITAVLQRVLDTWNTPVEIHFWGCPPPAPLAAYPQVRQVNEGVASYAEFAATFTVQATADIWLAPLKPNLFNRCKSAIKFWEYSAVGGAGIYSRLDPYTAVVRDGENGLLAGSEEEWFSAITQLAESPGLRLRLALKAQETLREQGLLSTQLEQWRAILDTAVVTRHNNLFTALMQRYSEMVQQRSDERHAEAHQLIATQKQLQKLEQDLHGAHQRNQVLQERSDQLEAILQNPRWRTWQRLKKVARLDLSPLPPHQPFD